MAYKPGDKIEVKLDDEILSGTFVPSPESRDDILILKLSSGYNQVIIKTKIKSISLMEKVKPSKKKISTIQQNSSLPKITLLHTGGTIAARIDYKLGAVLSGFITAEELLSLYPDLGKLANVSCRMVSNIASEDMRFGHYTAAALAFGLDNLTTPILLVGSQRSSDRGSSDAYPNLMSAVYFATASDFGGVGICMHYSPSDDICF